MRGGFIAPPRSAWRGRRISRAKICAASAALASRPPAQGWARSPLHPAPRRSATCWAWASTGLADFGTAGLIRRTRRVLRLVGLATDLTRRILRGFFCQPRLVHTQPCFPRLPIFMRLRRQEPEAILRRTYAPWFLMLVLWFAPLTIQPRRLQVQLLSARQTWTRKTAAGNSVDNIRRARLQTVKSALIAAS